jgi:hypothetical protein
LSSQEDPSSGLQTTQKKRVGFLLRGYSPDQWALISKGAEAAGETISYFLIRKALVSEQTSITAYQVPEDAPQGTTFVMEGGQWVNRTGSLQIRQEKSNRERESSERAERALQIKERQEALKKRKADDDHDESEKRQAEKEAKIVEITMRILENPTYAKIKDERSKEHRLIRDLNPGFFNKLESSQRKSLEDKNKELEKQIYQLRPLEAKLSALGEQERAAGETISNLSNRLQRSTKDTTNAQKAGRFLTELYQELLTKTTAQLADAETRRLLGEIQKKILDWYKINGPGSADW